MNVARTIYARQCSIVELDTQQERDFFNKTHIQQYVSSSVCYALEFDGEIVAAMSFIKSRFNKNYEYELLRYSSNLNCVVVGGGSRLLKYFLKENNPNSLISYCDLRWGSGNFYKQLGFTHLHSSPPNYKYFLRNKSQILYNRVKFQSHKLEKVLENHNPNLSEWENMQNNGYDRIWDCGNSVWGLSFDT